MAINSPVAGGLTDREHARIAEYVESLAGIQLPAHKRSLIETRLRKRQKHLGFDTLSQYVAAVFDNRDDNELIMLVDALTTNKTEFFREPMHFQVLEQEIVERIRKANGGNVRVRIWSAGCSSGEEPYTLSLVCNEIQEKHPNFQFDIFATDISVTVLRTAARGVYPENRIGPISTMLRRKYLYRSRDPRKRLVKMGPELRRPIRFSSLNLISDDFRTFRDIDFLLCRNVMIYFSLEDRKRIIDKFHRCLTSDGLLFLGHSETLPERTSQFQHMMPTVYRKLR
ncbi:CheR family methyltransferase [Marinobacter sediminum]|uniref:CheR family methyltransferase n=1 Tax=Marinobacter sediminum TaxID=256323 RepID=UPI00193982A9